MAKEITEDLAAELRAVAALEAKQRQLEDQLAAERQRLETARAEAQRKRQAARREWAGLALDRHSDAIAAAEKAFSEAQGAFHDLAGADLVAAHAAWCAMQAAAVQRWGALHRRYQAAMLRGEQFTREPAVPRMSFGEDLEAALEARMGELLGEAEMAIRAEIAQAGGGA